MKKIFFTALFIVALWNLFVFAQEARLLRFPAIHGNQVVFTYAGDLYTVSSSGGTARKITNDVGYESFPRDIVSEYLLKQVFNKIPLLILFKCNLYLSR